MSNSNICFSLPFLIHLNTHVVVYTLVLKFCVLLSSMQLAESAKLQFSRRDYSDHLAIVRAYDGWREAE